MNNTLKMGRRKKQLTQDQIDFRNSILRGEVTPVKIIEPVKIILSDEDKIRQNFYYLNNCIYWINEYIYGRVDKSQLLKTAKALQENAKKLEMLLSQ